MKAELTRILLIEDNPGDARLIREMVMEAEGGRFDLEVADRLATGLEHLKQKGGDVILLDLGLADSQGFEALTKVYDQAIGVPVVVLTDLDDESLGIEALRRGAQDYLVKEHIFGKGRALRRVLNYAVERKRVEEALQERESKLTTLFEILPVGVSILDIENKISFMNSALERILEISKEGLFRGDYKSRTYLRSNGTPMAAEEFAEARAIKEQKAVSNVETGVVKEDGTVIWTNVSAVPVKFPDWKVVIVTADITEHKRAEEELRKSEDRFKLIFEYAPDAYYINDLKGNFIDGNMAAEKTTGYKREELIGGSFLNLSLLSLDQLPKAAKLLADNAMGRPTGPDEFILKKKSGDKVPIEISTHPVKLENRTVVLGIARDITERVRTEEARRQAEENFRRSMDESPLGILIESAKGETLYANRAILDVYGYKDIEELINTPVEKRYTSESYVEFQKRKKIRQSREFGPSEYEISIVRKNGEVCHLHVFRKVTLWNDEKQFQTLYRDITEDKKREEILREFEATIQGQKILLGQQSSSVEELIDRLTHSREELEASYKALKANKDDLVRSEKLAFTGRMASSIAHEIRNPLTNIILSIRQLLKDDKIKPEGLNYAEIVERNTKRIEYLITELLNCARPIKLNLQPWDVHLVIKDVLNAQKVRLQTQRIKVIENLTSHPSILLVDKEYLGRVFLNIIINAMEAMPRGGALSIATKKEKGHFIIKIQDNGGGIPEGNLIRIFDPFFSTKKRGAGLGLSTCQNIVTSHGGIIEVESAWRKGSSFSVCLPLEPKPSGDEGDIKGKS